MKDAIQKQHGKSIANIFTIFNYKGNQHFRRKLFIYFMNGAMIFNLLKLQSQRSQNYKLQVTMRQKGDSDFTL